MAIQRDYLQPLSRMCQVRGVKFLKRTRRRHSFNITDSHKRLMLEIGVFAIFLSLSFIMPVRSDSKLTKTGFVTESQCPLFCISNANKYGWNTTCNSYATYCGGCSQCSGTTCTNQCSSAGTTQCYGNYTQTCGNYDDDSCLEWGNVIYCTYGCSSGVCKTNTTNQTGSGNQTNQTGNQTNTTGNQTGMPTGN